MWHRRQSCRSAMFVGPLMVIRGVLRRRECSISQGSDITVPFIVIKTEELRIRSSQIVRSIPHEVRFPISLVILSLPPALGGKLILGAYIFPSSRLLHPQSLLTPSGASTGRFQSFRRNTTDQNKAEECLTRRPSCIKQVQSTSSVRSLPSVSSTSPPEKSVLAAH